MLAGFLRGEKVRVPAELMLARIRRHGRMWGALVVRAAGMSLHWDARQAFSAIGSAANELIDQIDQRPDPRGPRPGRSQDPGAEPAQAPCLRAAARDQVAYRLRSFGGPADP